MNIALIGYGKMGRIVEQLAMQQGHAITAKIQAHDSQLSPLEKCDVCIEFTHPESVLNNIKKIAQFKKPIVVGTTGWYSQLDRVRELVEKEQIGLLYGANFSIGISLFIHLLKEFSVKMNRFSQYDATGIEYHHRSKVDQPSGTAQQISQLLRENMPRLDKMPFTSVRCGSIPGTHTLIFDSPNDSINLTHEARNREGFGEGALVAAQWLIGKKGLYTFEDYMRSYET